MTVSTERAPEAAAAIDEDGAGDAGEVTISSLRATAPLEAEEGAGLNPAKETGPAAGGMPRCRSGYTG